MVPAGQLNGIIESSSTSLRALRARAISPSPIARMPDAGSKHSRSTRCADRKLLHSPQGKATAVPDCLG